ncbi:MAG: DNA polymerase I [Phycisphaerales bacterium]|nr:DNA polymerase I [Phycisphaerales bacterium]
MNSNQVALPRAVWGIVDGHAHFFRAYYAIRTPLASKVTGEPTRMVYGFLASLFKFLREEPPENFIVVIDASGDTETFRSVLYPEYKAHRDPPPEDFGGQVRRCLEALSILGIPVIGLEGVEADDVIATLARGIRRLHPQDRVRILSRDKDLGQLIDANTTLYDTQAGREIGLEELFDSKGVRPEQIIDFLTLMGDSADNVPGVPGVGPKTAAQLLGEFGSIEGIYENIDKVKGKRRESLEASKNLIALSRTLVTLKDDCEIGFPLERAAFLKSRADMTRMTEFLRLLGISSLQKSAEELFGAAPHASPSIDTTPFEGSLFGTAAAKAQDPNSGAQPTIAAPLSKRSATVTLIRTRAELQDLVLRLRFAKRFAFDVETDSLALESIKLVGVSVSIAVGEGFYIPVQSPEPSAHLNTEAALSILRPLFEDDSIGKVAHNLKFDSAVLAAHGVSIRGCDGDTMLASWMLEPERAGHGLKALCETVLGNRMEEFEAVVGGNDGLFSRSFADVPLERAAQYAALDAEATFALATMLEPKLAASGLQSLYAEVEVPLAVVLGEMERAGIAVDRAELSRQRKELELRVELVRASIAADAPWAFNPDSPKQLAEVLFGLPTDARPGLGLKVVKRLKSGPSTDSEVLEKLVDDPLVTSTLPQQILEYRQLSKLVGTYLVALGEFISPTDGRIHARFNQTGTATGRLSSSEPNLQNIPIRSDIGRAIRQAFVAQEGMCFVAADYSQIELRILAHLSGDPGLMRAFESGLDIHRAVAAEVFGVAPELVDDTQRSAAKMVNFGIVYGITASGLARRLGSGCTITRAKEIMEGYRARFRGIDAFLESCVESAKSQGFVQTMLGRRRPTPQLHSRNPSERAFGERIAVNSVVQGSAADLIKKAMLAVAEKLPTEIPGGRMILQIHDELLLEVPESSALAAGTLLEREMRGAMTLRVPLEVVWSQGKRWSDV